MYLEDWGPHSHFLFLSVAGSCVKVKKGITQSRAFMIWFITSSFTKTAMSQLKTKTKQKLQTNPLLFTAFILTSLSKQGLESVAPNPAV